MSQNCNSYDSDVFMSLWREEAVPVLPVPVRLRIGSGSIGSGSVRPRSWFRFIVFRFGLGSFPVHAVPVRARLLLIFLSPDDVHGQTSLPCCTGTCVSSSPYCTRYSTQLIEPLLNSLNPYSCNSLDRFHVCYQFPPYRNLILSSVKLKLAIVASGFAWLHPPHAPTFVDVYRRTTIVPWK